MANSNVTFDILARDRAARAFHTTAKSVDRTATSIDRANRASALAARSFRSFGRTAARAGRAAAVGLAAGTAAAAAGMFSAAKAAAAEEQEMAVLAKTLRNTVGASESQIGATEKWITAMQNATGVADGDLRPALGKLLIATGDVGRSQALLQTALDISAARGVGLNSVVVALGKAANGSTTGLGRLGLATKDASGKALTFDQILQQASKTMGGAAAAAADTTAGRFAILRARLADIQETIGARLLPYLVRAGAAFSDMLSGITTGSGQIDGVSNRFATFGVRVRSVFVDKVIPAAKGFWRFLKDDLWPAVSEFGQALGTGITTALSNFSNAFYRAGDDTTSTTDKIRGFGDVITKIIIPFLTKLVEVTLPALGSALGHGARFAVQLGEAYLSMARIAFEAFSSITRVALATFGAILQAADKTRFLFPGMADQIHTAAAGFDEFSRRTVASLALTDLALRDVQRSLAAIRSKDVVINVITTRTEAIAGGRSVRAIAEGRAPTIDRDADARIASRAKDQADAISRATRAATATVLPSLTQSGARAGNAIASGVDSAKSKAATAAANVAKAALDAAKSKLADARRQLADYARGVRDSIMDFGGLGNFDQDRGVTGNSITSFLSRQLAAIQAFQKNLATLARRGVSKALIRQITDMGVEQGGRFASALARAPKSTITTANTRTAQIARIGTQIGNTQAQAQYGGQVAAAQRAMVAAQGTTNAKLEAIRKELRKERSATLTVKGDASAAKTVRNSTLALSF